MFLFPNLFLGILRISWVHCEVRELQAKGVKSLRVRGGRVIFITVSPG